MSRFHKWVRVSALVLPLLVGFADNAEAQGRGRGGGGADAGPDASMGVSAGVSISVGDRERILAFYSSRPAQEVEGLPPGIRRNLSRGKPLPPGIAKRSPPPELRASLELREGFEIVEVGLDVFLVEVATNVIHDVLMDIVR